MSKQVKIGDLVYHPFTEQYGIVVDIDNSHPNYANTWIEWTNGKRDWFFPDNVFFWKQQASTQKRKINKQKKKIEQDNKVG